MYVRNDTHNQNIRSPPLRPISPTLLLFPPVLVKHPSMPHYKHTGHKAIRKHLDPVSRSLASGRSFRGVRQGSLDVMLDFRNAASGEEEHCQKREEHAPWMDCVGDGGQDGGE